MVANRKSDATLRTGKLFARQVIQKDLDTFFLGKRENSLNPPRRRKLHKIPEQCAGSHVDYPLIHVPGDTVSLG
jgi:hypothetical protein